MTHGAWPDGCIDHINGQKADNRISNLRKVTHAVNMQNQHRAARTSKTGLLGVSPNKTRFVANINVDGRRVYLGSFATAHDAHSAYLSAKRELHAGCVL
jgi:hypothetical protein